MKSVIIVIFVLKEDLIRDNVLRRDLNTFDLIKLVPLLKMMTKSRQGKRTDLEEKKEDKGEEKGTSESKTQKLNPRDQIAAITNIYYNKEQKRKRFYLFKRFLFLLSFPLLHV